MAESNNCCFKQTNPLGPGNFPVCLLTYRHRSLSHPWHQLPSWTRAVLQDCCSWMYLLQESRSRNGQHWLGSFTGPDVSFPEDLSDISTWQISELGSKSRLPNGWKLVMGISLQTSQLLSLKLLFSRITQITLVRISIS